ncbi:MAG: hypothetical protein AB7O24_17500 [Kofleriaceae bacterium]
MTSQRSSSIRALHPLSIALVTVSLAACTTDQEAGGGDPTQTDAETETESGQALLSESGIKNPARVTVFRSNVSPFNYFAVDRNGFVLLEDAAADPVIDRALDFSGDVYVHRGAYDLSASFAGFDLVSNQRLSFDRDAVITIPSGFSGAVFRFPNGTNTSFLTGGKVTEAAPTQRRWTGVLLEATTSGVYYNTVREMNLNGPGVGIKLRFTGATSWLNGNSFDGLMINAPIVGVCFEAGGTAGAYPNPCTSTASFPVNYGPNRNVFNNILGQASGATTHGFKDICGRSNSFMFSRMWDMHANPNGVSANLTTNASDTIIIGGIMTIQKFTDAGTNTKIIDDWQQAKFPSVTASTVNASTLTSNGNYALNINQSTPASGLEVAMRPSADDQNVNWSLWSQTSSERLYCRRTPSEYTMSVVKQTASGTLKPFVFRIEDVPAGVGTEAYRVNTDATVTFGKATTQNAHQDMRALTATPANPPADFGRIYVRQKTANTDGLFVKLLINGAIVEREVTLQ